MWNVPIAPTLALPVAPLIDASEPTRAIACGAALAALATVALMLAAMRPRRAGGVVVRHAFPRPARSGGGAGAYTG